MKTSRDSEACIQEILSRDRRYGHDAYVFVLAAVEHTVKSLDLRGPRKHITGQQLLEGIRHLGLAQFGPMTRAVVNHWGIRTSRDFGEIVFNMVDAGLLGKTEEDTIQDFEGVYDLDDAFGRESGRADAE